MTEDAPHNPDHDYDDPAGAAAALRAMALAKAMPDCSTCHRLVRVVPGPGIAWDVETIHMPHCPQHDDNIEASELRLTPGFDIGEYLEVEHIGRLEARDPRDATDEG